MLQKTKFKLWVFLSFWFEKNPAVYIVCQFVIKWKEVDGRSLHPDTCPGLTERETDTASDPEKPSVKSGPL